MISSFAAVSRPPPKPSATSARPSSCSGPVRIAPAPSASAATARSGTPAAGTATRRQQVLTKPPDSLGRLEELAIWLACWQGRELPRLDHVAIAVFVANHGVAARGVSAYPPEVTAQMVANFAGGGAAINQIARTAAAE